MATSGIPNPCDAPIFGDLNPSCVVGGGAKDAIGAAKGAADAFSTTVQFAQDPFGYIAEKMQGAAQSLSDTVLPELVRLSQPQLDKAWFLDAYAVSFALAVLVFVVFLGWNFVQLARRRISGEEVAETLGFYTPLFFLGAMFGPMFGQLLLHFTGALSKAMVAWGVADSTTDTTARLQETIAAGDPASIAGGSIVAIIFFFCLILALLLAFLVLLVMLVTLYLSGVLIPLSLVWLVHPTQRAKGLRIVAVWVGICFTHVLLFLLLGVAFKLVEGMFGDNAGQPAMQVLVNLAVAVIALFMATLAPFGLLRFAPVGPSTGGSGPAMGIPRQGGAGGRRAMPIGGFPESGGDSQTAQLIRSQNASRVSNGYAGGGGADDGGAPVGGSSGSGPGGSGRGSAAMEPAAATGGAGLGAAGSPASGVSAGGAGASSGAAASGALGAAAGAAAVAGLAAAGTARAANSAGDMAADHMGHADGDSGPGPGSPPPMRPRPQD